MSASTKKTSAKQRDALVIKLERVDEATRAALHGDRLPKGRRLSSAGIDDKLIHGFVGHACFECTLFYARPNTQEVVSALKAQMRRLRKLRNNASRLPARSLVTQDSNTCEKHHGNCDEKDPC